MWNCMSDGVSVLWGFTVHKNVPQRCLPHDSLIVIGYLLLQLLLTSAELLKNAFYIFPLFQQKSRGLGLSRWSKSWSSYLNYTRCQEHKASRGTYQCTQGREKRKYSLINCFCYLYKMFSWEEEQQCERKMKVIMGLCTIEFFMVLCYANGFNRF